MDINGKLEGARLTGATAVVTAYGLTLNEWVAAMTILYLLIQMIVLLPKAFRSIHVLWRKLFGGTVSE